MGPWQRQVERQLGEDLPHVGEVELLALGDACAMPRVRCVTKRVPEVGASTGSGVSAIISRSATSNTEREVDLDDVVERVLAAGDRAPVAADLHALAGELERVAVARRSPRRGPCRP